MASSICLSLTAQTIDFVSTEHDYGRIKEDDGVAYHDFEFTNNGNAPLIIKKINTSCGCTTPQWSKEPVAPGKNGIIKVAYNASGRPNNFSKTVTVISNASAQSVVLRIKGFVVPHIKTIDEIFTSQVGDLRFEKMHVSFNRILIESIPCDTLKFLNKGLVEARVEIINSDRSFVNFKIVPEVVKPNEFGNIIVTYYPNQRNDWGFVNDRFLLSINGKQQTQQQISVSGTIEEDYSKLTEAQLANAPRAEFNTMVYNFGEAYPEGTPVEFDFVMTNTGKSNLLIRKVKASCGCTTVNPSVDVLKPGESGTIKAMFRTNGYSGRQSKSITVITNDPKRSTVVLRLSGNVEKDKSKLGVISLDDERVAFPKVLLGKVYSDTIFYRNVGKVDVKLEIDATDYASFSFVPSIVKPEKQGAIVVSYNPEKRNDWGSVSDLFIIRVNGVRLDKKLMVSARIEEDFSSLDKKQLKNAAHAVFTNKTLSFNPKSPKVEFVLSNKGRSVLNIYKVSATSGDNNISINVPKTTLAVGESTTIAVEIKADESKLSGYTSSIEVITNDPQQPTLVLTVSAAASK